jgi:uncharacterized protein (TIRG00374 family)
MSIRTWVTVLTLLLLAVVVFLAWPEIIRAAGLLESINVWILLLLIPVQFLSYYAAGGMIFNYLRSKGNLKDTSHWEMTRMALELNFVNHMLPSGGAAGFSYLGWVLNRHGVSAGRATMSQIVRFTMTFVTFVTLLVVAVIILILDHHVNQTILLLCGLIAFIAVFGTIAIVWIIASKKNLLKFSGWLTKIVNRIVKFFIRGRKSEFVKPGIIEKFFEDLHQDYLEIRRDKRILIKPFIWGLATNILDVTLLFISFWSLGFVINPAALFVAFGLSSIAGAISSTPGGAGAYEAIMIAFLATTGVQPEVAIAGTLLARVTLVLGTILFGYLFYQMTINKYGKRTS